MSASPVFIPLPVIASICVGGNAALIQVMRDIEHGSLPIEHDGQQFHWPEELKLDQAIDHRWGVNGLSPNSVRQLFQSGALKLAPNASAQFPIPLGELHFDSTFYDRPEGSWVTANPPKAGLILPTGFKKSITPDELAAKFAADFGDDEIAR